MNYITIFVRSALACAVACVFAAPSFALEAPDHIKKHHQKITEDAKAAAVKAQAAAKAAAEKAAHAAKSLDNIRQERHRPKIFKAHFHFDAVKPYLDDNHRMLAEMKQVATPQQAAAYAAHLQKDLPRLYANYGKMKAAMPHLVDGLSSGKMTPEMKQAATLLADHTSEAKGSAAEAMDIEMGRIAKLYPGIIPHFTSIVAWHEAP